MNPTVVRLDKHGLPIPATFEDIDGSAERPRRKRKPVGRTLVVLALIGVVGVGVLNTELREPVAKALAEWLTANAERKFSEDDLDGALADLNRAVAWSDRSPSAFLLRGRVNLEKCELQAALADFSKVVQLAPMAVPGYIYRSQAYQRLERHDAAIRDATQAVETHPEPAGVLLNSRAYVRAIAGRELEAALRDIEEAIELDGQNDAYLDTRGYLYFLQGQYEPALADLDQAIQIAESSGLPAGLLALADDPRYQKRIARVRRSMDRQKAVMYHHRGLIHEKLGHVEPSLADLRLADELGYNPAAGVY